MKEKRKELNTLTKVPLEETEYDLEMKSELMGVVIFSKKCSSLGYRICRNFGGKIKKDIILREPIEGENYMTNVDKAKVILIDLLLMFIAVSTKKWYIIYSAMFTSLVVTGNILAIIKQIHETHRTGIDKWNAAKSMGINAYKKLQRVPTINEIKQESMLTGEERIIEDIIVTTISVFISLSILIAKDIKIIFIFAIIVTIITIVMPKKLNLIQYLITSKPEEEMLELVQEALRYYEEMELKINTREFYMEYTRKK